MRKMPTDLAQGRKIVQASENLIEKLQIDIDNLLN